ncbi:Uncharacterized protein, PA2063/DUF2235 family [Amycolatopsis pretoriensis]|uniref:Uncharacterized protein, PA2063/DUF2235 family n=1 Tax=Amycolatopsis pretoriensis TaxID=218821 RepID=A0A1H5RGG3_9PSEU|nr:DUF2235 domain-containing protein [Amycolatopsis pretoriensis]SEF37455.1 Uncharacterized protein, PA2063/DUF2235 family [Amycolatopsis pretoriensis]
MSEERRHLVVCCDGTWNTPDQQQQGRPAPTNVARLHHTVAERGNQLRYYHPGVGTGPGLLDHLEGGLVGKGLSENIKSAYGWLARTYEPGDAIHLFGFSRGAFTVRSLSGMLKRCGLPAALKTAGSTEFWAEVDRLFTDVYRAESGEAAKAVPIEFLGVWDTVGSLGIPDWLGPLKLVEDHVGHLPRFHDTKLGDHVVHARQALAIDEMRGPFMPTLWSNVDKERDVEQVWFPGDHCDVGGGHDRTGLSDAALRWMIDECRAAVPDLVFDDAMYHQIAPDAQDVLHNSLHSVYTVLCPAPRAFPFITKDSPAIAASTVDRQATPPITTGPYRPGRRLEVGKSATVDVYAGKPWNWTGLYLEPGEYAFTAEGTWLNGKVAHHPDGTEADARLDFQDVLHTLATTSAWLQTQLARLNEADARSFGGRRCEDAKWMALIGAVAAPKLDAHDVQQPYDAVPIGGRVDRWTNRTAGYFYAYANDSWLGYSSNRGSLRLTVSRL